MKSIYALVFFVCCGGVLHAQVGIGTTTPNANAVLELKSPGNNQGFLTPRLTSAQRSAISLTAAENGLLVYDTDENKFYYWQVSQWLPLRSGNDVALAAGAGIDITNNTVSAIPDGDGDATNEIQDLQMVGNTLTITNNANATGVDLAPFAGTNTDNQILTYNATTGALDITGGNTVTVTPAGAAGGVLTGNYPNPALADNAVTTAKINNLAVTTGKINDLAVTNAKIANDAINSAKISDGTVTSADMSTTGVTAGTYGNATSVPQFAVDSKGRITTATNVTISGTSPGGTAGGVLTGTYPNPGLADNVVTNAKIADAAVSTAEIADGAVTVGKISPSTTNGQVLTTVGGATTWATPAPAGTGTVTSITAGTGLSGGTITSSGTIALTNTLSNGGTFGSSTEIPVITINQQGRITSATTATVSGGSGGGEGLAETLKNSPDAQGEVAFNLSSVSIGNWGGKAPGPGALNVNGSHFVNFAIVNDGYTVQPDDYILIGQTGSKAEVNIILPDAAPNKGRILIIRSLAQNIVEAVIVRAKEAIDGQSTSEPLFIDPQIGNNTAYAITLMSTGSEWITISRSIGKNRG